MKKPTNTKKLTLSSERVRALSTDQLGQVVGGAITSANPSMSPSCPALR